MITPEEVFAHLRRPPSRLALDAQYAVDKGCPDFLDTDAMAIDSPLQPAPPSCAKSVLFRLAYEDDDSAAEDSVVVEGRSRLHPTCSHGKSKANATEDNWYARCGAIARCREAIIEPTPETGAHNFVLTTADPEHDLRWWLGARALQDSKRSEEYITHARFSDQHLRDTLTLALAQLKDLQMELKHLLDFASCPPYDLVFQHVHADTEEDPLALSAEDLVELGRDELLEVRDATAREIDHVAGGKEKVEEEVVRTMITLAKKGAGGERDCLWRLGYCDEVERMY
ncbi:hypothetical protein B0A55_00578 [Friedmanniomyces simplex]|uniref:Uncharacterized protein n=1 Tax=Friedmanniomyces simplex TaxID=329884 RepID=A0A4U0Y5F1_9PEZI|nr:hypothetical protein B0A55_00578 [Friedmanniomyces simplex]